jgi:hypothetical protein
MEPVVYLDLVRGMLVSRYRLMADEVGSLAAAEEVVAVAREQLSAHDDTVWHPGARRLAQWLSSARAGGTGPVADRFEGRIEAFLAPHDPFRPPPGRRPAPFVPSVPLVSKESSR